MYNIFISSFNLLPSTDNIPTYSFSLCRRSVSKHPHLPNALKDWLWDITSSTPEHYSYKKVNIHSMLMHLEKPDSWVWILFVDFSCPFSIILPYSTVLKLHSLGVCYHLCWWLSNRPSTVHQTGILVSSVLTYSTGMCAEEPSLHFVHSWLKSLTVEAELFLLSI